MPRRKASTRMSAAQERVFDREVDRAVARARSSATAYQRKRAKLGLVTSGTARRRKSVSEAQALANYYRAYPKARRSHSAARHLQGLQGAGGRAQKKSPFGGFALFEKVQILQGKRKGRAAVPKPVRRARRRVRAK